jgi:hypothetical protein
LNAKEVAVSKLCCPACWDFFDILSEKHQLDKYKIRGRHSTVFPVQLPSWTCSIVVQELINRFDEHLRKEFITMRKDHDSVVKSNNLFKQVEASRKHGHSHNPSLQSVSSAITDASTFSAESDLNELEVVRHYLPEA